MKKIILSLLCLYSLSFSFEGALDKASKPYILKDNDLFTLICVNNYEYIRFKMTYSTFVQVFEKENSKQVPVSCKLKD